MEFCKPAFFGFFVLVFGLLALTRHGRRMGWLLLASAVYYAPFNPWFLLLLLASTCIDYVVAPRLPTTSRPPTAAPAGPVHLRQPLRPRLLQVPPVRPVHRRAVAGWFGWVVEVPGWKLVLPLGISFYTFETISYIVDVYRGTIQAVRRPAATTLLYILFFPHLLAGPIVRSGDFCPQLTAAQAVRPGCASRLGVQLFLLGCSRRPSSPTGWRRSSIRSSQPAATTAPVACGWRPRATRCRSTATSRGYSDMAIGAGPHVRLQAAGQLQHALPRRDIAEFWRRWHISLSQWLRDYLYIPLGGSRGRRPG